MCACAATRTPARINSDGNWEECTRKREDIGQLRSFAENVSQCSWRRMMEHYKEEDLEGSQIQDPEWRCGKCDVCLRLAPRAGGEPEQLDFSAVAMLLLMMVANATTVRKYATWKQIEASIKKTDENDKTTLFRKVPTAEALESLPRVCTAISREAQRRVSLLA